MLYFKKKKINEWFYDYFVNSSDYFVNSIFFKENNFTVTTLFLHSMCLSYSQI